MNKKNLNLLGIALLTTTMTLTSCSSDDDNKGGSNSTFVLDINDFKGNINDGEVILEAGKTYKLTGSLVVREGAVLTIPAGTTIQATNENSYIGVAQGGKLNVSGTSSSPVVFTSITGKPGTWGGVVIAGRAPINKGASAISEVGDLTYGGNITNDNSGTIRYLRIEYAGKIITGDKEFNGLSMFGVGNGTTIEYVQAYHGSDDGFEWFGGTVNTKYLVSTGNEDDQFDWTEGWNGTNEFWYGIEGFGKGNRGIEADNLENNETNNPISNPTIKNLTLIGITASEEPQGIELRRGTKAIFDNVFLDNWATGVRISGDISQGFVTSGGIKLTNVRFGSGVTTKYNAQAAAAITENPNATGAGSTTSTLPTWAQGWAKGL